MGCATSTSTSGFESPTTGHIQVVTLGSAGEEKPPASKPTSDEKPQNQFHEKYILTEKLGKGSFAQVHLATAVAHGNEVAVKVVDLFRGEALESDALKEVTIMRRLGKQPHCVALHESFREGPLLYLVMERCDMTLLQVLRGAPELTEDTLVPIIVEMLHALKGIHMCLVVHRDVKPENFLCSGEKRTVKLCDFGLSDVLPGRDSKLEGVVGTAAYMSPEMLKPEKHKHDTKTDIWSLGVLAYVLLCGHFPYYSRQKTSWGVKNAILAGTPEPTFQPAEGLGAQPSPAAAEFLRALLTRRLAARPTAADALQLPWVASPASSQRSARSLQPILLAAKRTGAFNTRESCGKRGNLDKTLASLQAQHHGAAGQPPARRPGFTRAATFDSKVSTTDGSDKPYPESIAGSIAAAGDAKTTTMTSTLSAYSTETSLHSVETSLHAAVE